MHCWHTSSVTSRRTTTCKCAIAGKLTTLPFGIIEARITLQREFALTATYQLTGKRGRNDYGDTRRAGDRVVSIGEKPFFDPKSRSRRDMLELGL